MSVISVPVDESDVGGRLQAVSLWWLRNRFDRTVVNRQLEVLEVHCCDS